MDKEKIITDIIYRWNNIERTEIDVYVCRGCEECSIATIDVSNVPYNDRFCDEIIDCDPVYDLAYEVAHDLGYKLEGEI